MNSVGVTRNLVTILLVDPPWGMARGVTRSNRLDLLVIENWVGRRLRG
jgi:hypothetical protein